MRILKLKHNLYHNTLILNRPSLIFLIRMCKKEFFNIIRTLSVSLFLSITFPQINLKDSFEFKLNELSNEKGQNWKTISIFNDFNFDIKKTISFEKPLINQSFSISFIRNKFSLLYFNKLSHKKLFAYSYLLLGDEVCFLSSHQEIDTDRLKNNVNQPLEIIDTECRIPTDNNPFMNPTIFGEDNNKTSCLSYNNKGIQNNIETKFNKEIYREASDIFGKNNSQRQFYTVPSKKYPNDQDAFKKWLYSTPPTCKEGNGIQCAANGYGTTGGPG